MEGRRGTTDEFATTPLHLVLFSAALVKLAKSIPVHSLILSSHLFLGWSGGAMVLGKLPLPGRPTYLEKSRAKAYCSCSRCGWGLFGHFVSRLSFIFSFSLSQGDGPI